MAKFVHLVAASLQGHNFLDRALQVGQNLPTFPGDEVPALRKNVPDLNVAFVVIV